MAVTACEAFINEAARAVDYHVHRFDNVAQPRHPILALPAANVVQFAEEMTAAVGSKTAIHEKYQMAARIMTGREFDKGAQPYEAFYRLIQLRDWLIHLRETPPKSIKALHSAKLTIPPETFVDEAAESRRSLSLRTTAS